MELVESLRFRLLRIELLVLLGVIGLLLLVVLGAYRRRSSNKVVKLVIWASYAVSYSLVSYTLGLIQSFPYGNGLFSVWAICLFLFLGSADSISAYSLEDNDRWKRFCVHQTIQAFWMGSVVGTFTRKSDFKVRLWIIYAITLMKTLTRIAPFRWASNSYMLSENTKCIADYMSYEHGLHHERDPVTMRGYRYVVAGEDELERYVPQPPDYLLKYTGAKLVTVEQIWECDGGLLVGERGGQLKDLCLSMALSKMLNRRFAGFQPTESELHKAREFLFHGLLHGKNYCERAFRVIEAELAFVHDYFYTKYYIIYSTNNMDTILSLIMIPLCVWQAAGLWQHFREPKNVLILIPSHNNRNYDALITFVIVIGIALIELFQVLLYLASGWCKVALISRYAVRDSWRSSSWVVKSIGYIVNLKSFRNWEDSLGQYTLLKNFDHKPRLQDALHCLTFSLVDEGRNGQQEGKHVRLSRDIKEAVLESLKLTNGRLTNGVTSLQANQVFDLLSWACTLPTTAHTILAWHIATTICKEHSMGTYTHSHASVACTLSNYCAYLLVFAPKLLPDHSCVSGTIFDALVREARELKLQGEATLAQRCQKLIEKADEDPEGDRLIIRGARLGVQLTRRIQDPAVRWKVLHDFWTEFMIYVAPSKDAWAHLETLTRGGEFITHLWALLTHGGILNRETAVQNHDI
ncbi:unnamed protein product [Urochloa decumbens]|uniref:DUF4220 domain-containing protein n=1 Tax=Urochloa decumbens TaxID=240449 RepID=A0ABC9G0J2_9POAL